MDVQALKNKILQLAIQGKLVKQNPEDETASVLLEKIKKKREKLIKEKKIRKLKKLEPIGKDEKPFDIPNNWEWVRLGHISSIVGGGTPKTAIKEYWEKGVIPWITPADLSNNTDKYISKGRRNITELGLNKSSAQLMPKGTVLFSSRAPIGYTVIAKNDISTNQGFKSCIPFIMEMNEYLYYYLIYSAKIINENASGTTFKEVSGTKVSNLILPLPPLAEQKRIVEKVEQLFNLLEQLDLNKNDILETINIARNQILQKAIEGKLVEQNPDDEPASVLLEKIKEEKNLLIKEKKIKKSKSLPEILDEEKLFDIPDNWEWVRLGKMAERIHYGYTASATVTNTGVKFLRITDIQNNKVDWPTVPFCMIEEDDNRYTLCLNDILIARTGGTVGKSFIVDCIDYKAVFASYLIRIIPYLGAYPKYLKMFLDSPFYWEQLIYKSKGTGQPNVNATSLSELLMPLPPLEEQKRIVEKLDYILKILDNLENELISKV